MDQCSHECLIFYLRCLFGDISHLRKEFHSIKSRVHSNHGRWTSIRSEETPPIFITFYLPTVSFSGVILAWVRFLNTLETRGNRQGLQVKVWCEYYWLRDSLERIKQYLDIEHEPKPTKEGVPPAYWPASGSLNVEKLSARYSNVST